MFTYTPKIQQRKDLVLTWQKAARLEEDPEEYVIIPPYPYFIPSVLFSLKGTCIDMDRARQTLAYPQEV